MPITTNTATAMVKAILAATSPANYGSTITDTDRRAAQEITDAVLSADAEVCRAGCETEGWGHRTDFRGTANLVHGGTIPSHLGPLMSVQYSGSFATLWDDNEIDRERTDPLGITAFIDAHYSARDGIFLLNKSGTATVYYATFAMTSSCQAPVEYLGPVVRGAVGMILAKDGNKVEAAQAYGGQFQQDLQGIRAGAKPVGPQEVEGG